MKVSTIAVGAAALVPAVAAQKNPKTNFDCTTVASNVKTRIVTATQWAQGTTTKTKQPKTTETLTLREPVTSVTTVTNIVRKKTTTTTETASTQVKVNVTNTVTATITAKGVTISPDPVTSTVATPAGFTPAVSALSNANAKREAAPQNKKNNKSATLCQANIAAKLTVSTTLPVITITKSITKPGSTIFSTTIKNVNRGGTQTVTVTTTATNTRTITSVTTTSTTIKPTVTLAAQVIKYYAACADFNLLDYTLSTIAPSTDSNSTTTDPSDNDGSDERRRLRRSARLGAFPQLKIAKRATYHVGINAVSPATGLTASLDDNIDTAYDCCAKCQAADNCAGSSFGPVEGCTIYLGNTCSASQSQKVGTFTYDSEDLLEVGSGEIVSNGKCGAWASGGQQASDDGSDDDN
ncbi:hypothetical protein KVT40_001728 [Elsinoe batatas]|uniref:Apple domain-containing protein n=1 Tax=Elsinoe batatas TaxID=2601811 RepID=A0A8K0L5J3_9PEZI|nr:hypothetical protein KVT40_001728 [Elsinoe batatas]